MNRMEIMQRDLAHAKAMLQHEQALTQDLELRCHHWQKYAQQADSERDFYKAKVKALNEALCEILIAHGEPENVKF